MRRFSGLGGYLYAVGQEFAFTDAPMDDCGDGFTWRCADPTMLCWSALHAVEVYEAGVWTEAPVMDVRLDVAEVQLRRCFSGCHVRAHGFALPTTLVAEGREWSLEQQVAQDRTLDGPAIGLGSATAFVDLDAYDWSVKTVMAVLPSRPSGAFVGFGETEPVARGVKVIFDNRGVTHANG